MCITVTNKYKRVDLPKHMNNRQYVGRGNPLGNPFPITETDTRDIVCDKYATWLMDKINNNDVAVCNELNRLYVSWQNAGNLQLECFCYPQRCHASTIRIVLNNAHNKEN